MIVSARVFEVMKTVKHGTRYRYARGCRCDNCSEAERLYHPDYRLRGGGSASQTRADLPTSQWPGPVELAVTVEIGGLAAEARPGLAQVALALARVMDDPKSRAQQPTAPKVLATILEKLRSAQVLGRCRNLSMVQSECRSKSAPERCRFLRRFRSDELETGDRCRKHDLTIRCMSATSAEWRTERPRWRNRRPIDYG